MTNSDSIVLVDQNDREVGVMDKILAHQRGLLHRAFSVFIFRSNRKHGLIKPLPKLAMSSQLVGDTAHRTAAYNAVHEDSSTVSTPKLTDRVDFSKSSIELLLQQRHFTKYHSGGLWTNACCGHPRPQEEITSAARRRLYEEVQLCVPLRFLDKFYYRAECANGLIEHEIDYVFVGDIADQQVVINPDEIETVRWVNLASLQEEIAKHPDHFTPWFKPALAVLTQESEFG